MAVIVSRPAVKALPLTLCMCLALGLGVPGAGVPAYAAHLLTPQGASPTGAHTLLLRRPVVTGVSPRRGPAAGGTTVTITGSGFAVWPNATVIMFGSVASEEVSCATTTSCTVIAPAHKAGTVPVRANVDGVISQATPATDFRFLTGIFLVGPEGGPPRMELRDTVNLETSPEEGVFCYPYPEGELVANEGRPEIVTSPREVPHVGMCAPPPDEWSGLLSGFSIHIYADGAASITGQMGVNDWGCVYEGSRLTGHLDLEQYLVLSVQGKFRRVRDEEQEFWAQKLAEVKTEIKALKEKPTRTPAEQAQLAELRKEKIELEGKVAETGERCQAKGKVSMVVEDEGANVIEAR